MQKVINKYLNIGEAKNFNNKSNENYLSRR